MNPEITEHVRFLRRIAVAILQEFEAADDAVQEAYLEAVRRGGAFSPRWMAAVVRNKALNMLRGRRRRAAREQASARREAVPAASDAAAEAELHQRVAEAVSSLAEPYRSVILQRFHHGLAPREIARRSGEPVETVKTRLRRALRLLRGALDRSHDGDTRRWAFALAAFALPARAVAGGTVVAAAALVATTIAVASHRSHAPAPRPESNAATRAEQSAHGEAAPPVVSGTDRTTMRWPVQGDVPDGSDIRFRQDYRRPTFGAEGIVGSIENRTLVVTGLEDALHTLIAIAPDGSLGRVSWDRESKRFPPVAFRPARTVRVRVVERGGKPLASAPVRLLGGVVGDSERRTGSDGVVVFESLYGGVESAILVQDERTGVGYRWLGSVDLAKGDGRIEAVIEPLEPFTLVLGEPLAVTSLSVRRGAAADRTDGEGTISFRARRLRVGAPLGVSVQLEGAGSHFVEFVGSSALLEAPVPARLRGTLLPPRDGEFSLELERWSKDRWVRQRGGVASHRNRFRADSLTQGRYRVVETNTGLASESCELAAGQSVDLPPFDISGAAWVVGRVEPVPPGATRVLARWPGQAAIWPPVHVKGDGAFRVRVPGDREVTIELASATHFARPARVVDAGGEILLQARPATTLRLVLPAHPTGRMRMFPSIRLTGAAGSTVFRNAVRAGDRFEFGPLPTGVFRLFLDADGFRPKILERVVLTQGRNDLDHLALSTGNHVRIKVRVPEGQSAPVLVVSATALDAPVYTRSLNSRGENPVLLHGLGRGRFRLRAWPRGALAELHAIDREFTSDGHTPVDVTYDLR